MPAQIRLSGIVVIVGNYGSGKTEVAINLAVDQRAQGIQVHMADLDLVNPYFRTREARRALRELGIDMVLPPEGWLLADLPILSPQVAGLIRHPGQLAILDVGGDGVGATVLSALSNAFASVDTPLHMLQVVNPFRPNTGTVARCLAMRDIIESASRLKVTGWIGNAHLMDETTIDHIRHGHNLLRALAEASGVPLICMAVDGALAPQAADLAMGCPLLIIKRQLVPPWRRAVSLTGRASSVN
jgi:hypothetical protein